MASSTNEAVGVSLDVIGRGYNYVRFRASFWGIREHYNGDPQKVEIYHGAECLHSRTFSGRLANHNFSYEFSLSYGNPSLGGYHSFVPHIETWDIQGDGRFHAKAIEQGNTLTVPNFDVKNFKLGSATATSRIVNFSNLHTPQNERLSYQKSLADYFGQFGNGVKSGSFSYSNLSKNTKVAYGVGMVPANSAGPYINNCHQTIDVYPAYSSLVKGSLLATRNSTNPSTILVKWGAWSNFGNMKNWKGFIEVSDATTNAIIKQRGINSLVAGEQSITNLPLDKALKVCVHLYGAYHDGVTKHEYSSTINLGYANNTWIKVGGTWRRGIRTYVKVNGIWKASNGLVKVKSGGVWK